jgi:hypothetical protein
MPTACGLTALAVKALPAEKFVGRVSYSEEKEMRPEFRGILLDQRGAAVILWSCFVVSIPIYIVIARRVLSDAPLAGDAAFAAIARILLWILTIVDLGYYIYWRKKRFDDPAILREAHSTKLFRALQEFSGAIEERAAYVVSTYVTRKVVLFAIIEAVAVYGLVAAVIGGFVADQYFLSFLAVILLGLEFPSAKSFDRLMRASEQCA